MTVNEFICRIREFKPFDDLFSEFEKEWEGYPKMIFFSFLGKRIAQDCDRYTEEESDFIFEIIEQSILVGDSDLKEYVATCVLEAFFNHAYKMGEWGRLRKKLGQNSLNYIKDWLSVD